MNIVLYIILFTILDILLNLFICMYMYRKGMLDGTFDTLIYVFIPLPFLGTLFIIGELIKNIKYNKRPEVIAYRKYWNEFFDKKDK